MPPPMSREQRRVHLERARELNMQRGRWLMLLRTGKVSPVQMLARAAGGEDAVVGGIRVRSMLLATPGIGPARAAQILTEAAIPDCRRLGGLTVRRRDALLRALALTRPEQAINLKKVGTA